VVPKALDEGVEMGIIAAQVDAAADDIIGGGGDNAPCQGILAPGGQAVGVLLLDLSPAAVVPAG